MLRVIRLRLLGHHPSMLELSLPAGPSYPVVDSALCSRPSASRKTQGSNQGWTVEVDPTGNGAVSITLPETTDCDASGAICTEDSRKLSHPTSATVAGPPAIAVSDATV